MENYYGGPKGLQGIQGEQGEQGFNFLIKGIIQDNTCGTIDDVLAFIPTSIDLPSFEENKWFVYYFNKLKISFGYSKDKNNNIQKIFLGYQHSGFWADNNTDLLKFSISDKISQENGNINFNFSKDNLKLNYVKDNQNKKIILLDKSNKEILTSSNFKENKKGDYYLNVLDKKIDGWIKNPILSNANVSYYEKNNEVTFSLYVSKCPDFMEDITETFTVQIGSTLSSIESQSSILQSMDSSAGYYKHETEVPGYSTTIFTINGNTNADIAYEGALSSTDIIDETWYGASFPVVEAH